MKTMQTVDIRPTDDPEALARCLEALRKLGDPNATAAEAAFAYFCLGLEEDPTFSLQTTEHGENFFATRIDTVSAVY